MKVKEKHLTFFKTSVVKVQYLLLSLKRSLEPSMLQDLFDGYALVRIFHEAALD